MYTVRDYKEAFGGQKRGYVLVDHEGDLVWTATRPRDVQQARWSIALDWPTLMRYQAEGGEDLVVAAPGPGEE
jgi:hypothetical protein